MRPLRNFIKNKHALSSFLSVMIFAAITVVLIVIVWIFNSGIVGDAPKELTPAIGLIQQGDYILITSVQNGPVQTSSIDVQIVEKDTGQQVGEAQINDGGDGDIDNTDSISLSGVTNGVYTVSLIKGDLIVGHCQYQMFTE
jgi:hypothetical protein